MAASMFEHNCSYECAVSQARVGEAMQLRLPIYRDGSVIRLCGSTGSIAPLRCGAAPIVLIYQYGVVILCTCDRRNVQYLGSGCLK